MLIINNMIFEDVPVYNTFKNFDGVINGKKYQGKVLTVNYNSGDFRVLLETNISYEKLQTLVTDERKDISKNIINVKFDDSKGWKSLDLEQYNCFITKKNDDDYYLEFNLVSQEYNIQIKEIINI